MCRYVRTKAFWDDLFSRSGHYDPFEKVPSAEIEQGLAWLCEESRTVLDYGCGSGRALARCLCNGVESGHGMDISERAIEVAERVMEEHDLLERVTLVCCGLEALERVECRSFDAAILFNIIDNLMPEDGAEAMRQIPRILKPGGRVLMKLNPYLEEGELRESDGYERVADSLFREESGIYLWNLDEDAVRELIRPHFRLYRSGDVHVSGSAPAGRIYYLVSG